MTSSEQLSQTEEYGNEKHQAKDKNQCGQFSSQGPVPCFVKAQNLPGMPVIYDRYRERNNAETDHRRGKFTWAEIGLSAKRDFLGQVLKEFVNRETETDQRDGRSDPGH